MGGGGVETKSFRTHFRINIFWDRKAFSGIEASHLIQQKNKILDKESNPGKTTDFFIDNQLDVQEIIPNWGDKSIPHFFSAQDWSDDFVQCLV